MSQPINPFAYTPPGPTVEGASNRPTGLALVLSPVRFTNTSGDVQALRFGAEVPLAELTKADRAAFTAAGVLVEVYEQVVGGRVVARFPQRSDFTPAAEVIDIQRAKVRAEREALEAPNYAQPRDDIRAADVTGWTPPQGAA